MRVPSPSNLTSRLRSGLRARVDEVADRIVARALGQSWAPLTPVAERVVPTRVRPTLPPRPAPPPLELDHVPEGAMLLDIREPHELASGVPEGAMLLPMDLVPHALDRLPADADVLVICAAGARSLGVATWLRLQGRAAWSFAPGIGGLPACGVAIVPPGGTPGARVVVPAGTNVDGATVHAPLHGEEIATEGQVRRVRVVDGAGLHVEVRLPAEG